MPSSALIDELFEIQDLLKGNDPEQATRKLRQLIVSAERNVEEQQAEPDPLAEQTSKWLQLFLDDEHAIELTRIDKSRINIEDMARHVEERQRFLTDGLLAAPSLSAILDLCSTLGHIGKAQNLNDAIAELNHHLRHHLIMDEELRQEVAKLGQSLATSLTSLEQITHNIGDDTSALNQARSILAKELPSDPKAALAHLRRACDALTSAEGKLGYAVKAFSDQMQIHIQEVAQLRNHLKQAHKEARHDALTGLANRRELREYFDAMDDRPASLLILDLDYFKKVNDTYGHDAGDEVLAQIGERLTTSIREGDIVARIGGEEFIAVLKGVGSREVFKVAEKIRQLVTDKDIATSSGGIPITLSVGAASREANESISAWKKRADLALYEAKENGRDCTRLSSG